MILAKHLVYLNEFAQIGSKVVRHR